MSVAKGIARKRAPASPAWTHGTLVAARSRAMLFNQQPTTNNQQPTTNIHHPLAHRPLFGGCFTDRSQSWGGGRALHHRMRGVDRACSRRRQNRLQCGNWG